MTEPISHRDFKSLMEEEKNVYTVEKFNKSDKSVLVKLENGNEWYYLESDDGFTKLTGQYNAPVEE